MDSTSGPSAAPLDRRALLSTVAALLEGLCATNDRLPAGALTKFHAARVPEISVHDYLARVADYSDCSTTCFVLALVYIDRLHTGQKLQVCSLNIHRLLITSVMLAAKFFDDHYYNNAYYARIGGVSRDELNQLELEFLFMIGFSLSVEPDCYGAYETEVRAHCARLSEREAELRRAELARQAEAAQRAQLAAQQHQLQLLQQQVQQLQQLRQFQHFGHGHLQQVAGVPHAASAQQHPGFVVAPDTGAVYLVGQQHPYAATIAQAVAMGPPQAPVPAVPCRQVPAPTA